jgi:hypothetical protein
VRIVSAKSPRRAAALIVAGAAVMLAAACGGSNSSSTTSTSGGQNPGTGTGNNAFTAYIQCLSKNGVTISMPSRAAGAGAFPSGRPSGGFTRPSGEPRPSGSSGDGNRGGFGGGFFQKPANVDDATWQKAQTACASVRPSMGAGRGNGGNGANAAYFNCLKQHGVTDTANLNSSDATTKKAMETCKVLKPTATPSASPTA